MQAAANGGLADRLRQHYQALDISLGSSDPAGFDLVVNATPMGMNAGDTMPMMCRASTRERWSVKW